MEETTKSVATEAAVEVKPTEVVEPAEVATSATVISVRPFFNDGSYSLCIVLTDDVIGKMAVDTETGEFVKSSSNTLFASTDAIIAMLCEADSRFAAWYQARKDIQVQNGTHPFAPSVASFILSNAELTINTQYHDEGDTYTTPSGKERQYKFNGFVNRITGVKFAADIDAALNKYLPKDRSQVIADLF